MGAIVPRREELSFDQLVGRSNCIALVRPDDPPLVIEEVATGTPPADPSVPHPPIVKYRLGFERYVVEEWFKPRTGPERIEVESPSNEASARDARDEARGMLGHTYPIVLEYVVDVPDAWRPTEAHRIVFLGHPGAGTRYPLAYKGLSLGVGAADAVREATRPPDPPPRRFPWWVLGLAALVALAVWRCRSEPAPPEVEVVFAHYAGWDALVAAAGKGDRERAREIAYDLTGGPEVEVPDGPAADALDTVSGALGFVTVAEDRAELLEAIGVAARGCDECHVALGVIGVEVTRPR